jgi:hypothetical protein
MLIMSTITRLVSCHIKENCVCVVSHVYIKIWHSYFGAHEKYHNEEN